MHFKMLSASCYSLNQSKVLSSGYGLKVVLLKSNLLNFALHKTQYICRPQNKCDSKTELCFGKDLWKKDGE